MNSPLAAYSTLTIYSVEVWLCVQTAHKSGRLEFVLHAADVRNGNDSEHNTYLDKLFDMLQNEFNANKCCSFEDTSVYGNVLFNLRADTYEDLLAGIQCSERVIARWITKYRINDMRDTK